MPSIVRSVTLVLLYFFSLVPLAFAQQNQEIEIVLQSRLTSYGNDTPLTIVFTLTNRSGSPIRVLRWTTPIDGVSGQIFSVTRGSQPIQYIGPLVKRAEPTEADFIDIEPGRSISATVDLSLYYAIYEAGNYAVTYDTERVGLLVGHPAALRRAQVLSNAATFRLLSGRIPPERIPLSAPRFDHCDSSQQADIGAALAEANNIASAALQVLQGTPSAQQPNSQRYRTWFGAHTVGLYAKTTGNFSKIADALANKTITFGCHGSICGPDVYAYVFRDQPYNIFVCQKFWSAALKGTDSRSGTIVHEISHFEVVAFTDDYSSGGQNFAKILAVENPPQATENGDSHEYFAENSPELPM
ncbi:peptidase M35 [Mesorhizobium sp. M4B.F.Ca.ET.215.01.1.1]|uniref:M35 family metallo-endopeptidase n=1 Tax=unclassified Mesorhizobium TaxID=325217 RepID=UPI000FCB125A|nr:MULTISPECIES: M35 family metallo-endopeptidase [unclassified Mesorhizobium]RUW27360.1 peptidase M35 [Mesorhizobium sp. M4B.F.Ca.ET.013.02.1.1]RVD42281.1 peptidase M35 [Mesorhizobium sp. M4B.F.Ca.ET.019.03.1.1]RWF67846.1 MAG: peptidase M35 [Mesorhizobium sp.]TGQ18543.1 peptidase M35 [Mesorhizobium sp. M4B.F.Ca.ET.215.01.1.1]TGQ40204.1 peptidase M35 [Mesorhizobium sp. M4B.F.Ca.ET.214.01.1.1]